MKGFLKASSIPRGMKVYNDEIVGFNLFAEGPQFKYVFGAKFLISQWNKQVDGFLERYWEQFEDLENRKVNSSDVQAMIDGLVAVGVTFWAPTIKGPFCAKSWKELTFHQITKTNHIKELLRSPVKTSRERVLREREAIPLEQLPLIPTPVFAKGERSLKDSHSSAMVSDYPAYVLYAHGEGVSAFQNATVEEKARRICQNHLDDTSLACLTLENTLIADDFSFWIAISGPRDNWGQLLQIDARNAEAFEYERVTDNRTIARGLAELLRWTLTTLNNPSASYPMRTPNASLEPKSANEVASGEPFPVPSTGHDPGSSTLNWSADGGDGDDMVLGTVSSGFQDLSISTLNPGSVSTRFGKSTASSNRSLPKILIDGSS